MSSYVQICLIATVVFFLSGVRCDGQVTGHIDPESTAKTTIRGTLTEGGTMAGGVSGNTMSKTLEFSPQSTADKLDSGRFLKENRRNGDFVGTDAGERREFVGAQGASGSHRVRPTTSGLRIKKSRDANVRYGAAAEQRNAIYDPRLIVAFEVNRRPPREVQAALRRRLLVSTNLNWVGSVEVTVRGDTAVLSGKAASSRDRELASLVLMLEPGISKVENRLTVADKVR